MLIYLELALLAPRHGQIPIRSEVLHVNEVILIGQHGNADAFWCYWHRSRRYRVCYLDRLFHSTGFGTQDAGVYEYEIQAIPYYKDFGATSVDLWRNRQHVRNVTNPSGVACVETELSWENDSQHWFSIKDPSTSFPPVLPNEIRVIEWVQPDYPGEVTFAYSPGNEVWWMVGAGYNGHVEKYCTGSPSQWLVWWEGGASAPQKEFDTFLNMERER